MDDATLARFTAKVERRADVTSPHVDTPCWMWTAATTGGYGTIGIGGQMLRAHRVAYEHWVGPMGAMCVLHRCDTPSCVNPAHLFLGTRAANATDREAKGRGSPARGTSNGFAKLTPEKVRAARRAHASGRLQVEIAREIGVHPSVISLAIRGKTWSHVD